jgi:hypothetical protein
MFRVYLMNETPPGNSRLVATTSNPQVVASAAAGMLSGLPEFRGQKLRRMISHRREALLSVIEGINR